MEYGNLAYDEDYYVPKYRKIPQKQQKQQKQPPVKRPKSDRVKYVRYIGAIIAMALSAGFMISTFVSVHETKNTVASLESKLSEMEAVTSQKAFDLDHSIDLATIEEEATSRLGMQRPEKYQTVYVNVNRDDVTEKTADEVESTSGKIVNTLKNIIGNIVEFFSIK